MKRRTVLRLLSAGIGSGMAGGLSSRAWAQAPSAPGAARVGASEITAVPGVSTREIRIGMSAAFKGTAAGLGTEFYRGAQAYYDEVNSRGGVHGRTITVVALDDGYEPTPVHQEHDPAASRRSRCSSCRTTWARRPSRARCPSSSATPTSR